MVQHRNFLFWHWEPIFESSYFLLSWTIIPLCILSFYWLLNCPFSSGKEIQVFYGLHKYILYGFYSHLLEWNSRFYVILMEVIKRSKHQGLLIKAFLRQFALPSICLSIMAVMVETYFFLTLMPLIVTFF